VADTKTTLTWQLRDEVSGPAKGMSSALGKAEDKAKSGGGAFGKLGGSLGGLVSPLGLAAAGIGVLSAGLVSGFSDMAETQKLNAQTAAVLKSTGNAANISAQQVSDLAQSISDYSGIDDQAIQAGENLLLTFTNIQNRAGEGNDIFNQSNAILADMATAMGTDVSSQAIQLGKALNDPVAGISALTRVGVTFSDEQKTMIKSMMDAGDTAGAQKVIMAELTKEFGGSAKAAGDTAAGAFNKLQNKVGDLLEAVATGLMPVINGLVDFMLDPVIPVIKSVADVVGPVLTTYFTILGRTISFVMNTFIKPAIAVIKTLVGWIQGALGWLHSFLSSSSQAAQNANALSGGRNRFRPGDLPHRAAGGLVAAGGAYLIGEQGPEVLQMGRTGGNVIPNAGWSSQTLSGVTIQGISEAQILDMVDRGLYFRLQRAAPTLGRT